MFVTHFSVGPSGIRQDLLSGDDFDNDEALWVNGTNTLQMKESQIVTKVLHLLASLQVPPGQHPAHTPSSNTHTLCPQQQHHAQPGLPA